MHDSCIKACGVLYLVCYNAVTGKPIYDLASSIFMSKVRFGADEVRKLDQNTVLTAFFVDGGFCGCLPPTKETDF
jgi:hypothetical protein